MAQTSIAIKVKQAKAEKVFRKANPDWKVVQPWVKGLKLAYNPAEWMLQGTFKAVGPLGNTRLVIASIYRDGIRIH